MTTDSLATDTRITILYCPDNTIRAHRIANLVDGLEALVPDQADLPAVTWVTE